MTIAQTIFTVSRTIESALRRAYVYCHALDHDGDQDIYHFKDGSVLIRSKYGLAVRR